MADRVSTVESIDRGSVSPRQSAVQVAANGLHFTSFADTGTEAVELQRMVQAVPAALAAALRSKVYYFVPLVLSEGRASQADGTAAGAAAGASVGHRGTQEETMVSPGYNAELADLAICHRNVELATTEEQGKTEGVFISTRLLSDRFSLAFELFINVGHAFVDAAGVAEGFGELAWNQAMADVRGETSQDAWESRAQALGGGPGGGEDGPGSAGMLHGKRRSVDEKAKGEFLEAAFADAVAIYLLSLATDFDYSELREREYPLLAPQALAERLRLVNRLFPANVGYEFAIRYRRRG
jgi:hypothetical protein